MIQGNVISKMSRLLIQNTIYKWYHWMTMNKQNYNNSSMFKNIQFCTSV